MKKILVLYILLVFVYSSFGQSADKAKINEINRTNTFGVKPAVTPFSLLDLSRIRWSHSYSVSFFSGGYGSSSVGLLNSTMMYDISPKISLSLNLSIAHNPSALWGNGNSNSSFLPGFLLDYHPSNKFRMTVGMQYYNNYNSPYYFRPYRGNLAGY